MLWSVHGTRRLMLLQENVGLCMDGTRINPCSMLYSSICNTWVGGGAIGQHLKFVINTLVGLR